jgi:Na+/glutamate symporter
VVVLVVVVVCQLITCIICAYFNLFNYLFNVYVAVHCDKFRIIKPVGCTNFSISFWNETLQVLDSSFVHHQEYFNVHTAMVFIIPVCGQLANRIRMELSFIHTPDDVQRNCLKHVEFHSKINLRNLWI